MATNNAQNIQVAVRCRPLNEREGKLNSYSVIECNERAREITAFDKSGSINVDKKYTFDRVFGVTSKQSEVYNQVVKPVVLEVIEGYNCTIFAYGQTGTGKTHTMEGDWVGVSENQSWDADQKVGVIPRSVAHLFTALNSISSCDYSVKISFIELYNEELTDLLSESSNENDKLRIYEDPARKGSVMIPGLEEIVVKNKNEVYKILQKGSQRRQQAATLMNAKSSRSHSIFTCTVFIKEKSIEGEETIKVGKLNLVDLAGSENIERSGATGRRAAEAGRINKSLTTLGRVITALVEHRDHVPYRESNLTRLLQDSLGGRTKTTLIATISPAVCNLEETLSTLDYAHKAKSIRNKPEVNQKLVKKALIKEYSEEIEKLKRELYSSREKNGIYLPQDIYDEMENKLSNQKEEIREHLTKISSLTEDMERLEELFTDTKQNLEERNVQLKKTSETLAHTEKKLDLKTVEHDETKHLLEEQVKTEKKLYKEAEDLQKLTISQNIDNTKLHQKLDRMNDVAESNLKLTEHFTRHMNNKVMELTKNDLAMSVEHTNSLCNVCDALHVVSERLEEMRTENVCQLNIYQEKQQNWLELREKFFKEKIKDEFESFYKQFIDEMTRHSVATEATYNKQIQLCDNHRSIFVETYEQLTHRLVTFSEKNKDFQETIEQNTKVFMKTTEYEENNDFQALGNRIDSLMSAANQASQDIQTLYEANNSFQASIMQSMQGLQQAIESISKDAIDSSTKIQSRVTEMAAKTDMFMMEINKLKQLERERKEARSSNRIKQFSDLIGEPVVKHLESEANDLDALKTCSEKLYQDYDKTGEQWKQTTESNKLCQDGFSGKLNELAKDENKALSNNCGVLASQLHSYGKESERFFHNFNGHSVEGELEEVLETVSEVSNEIKICTHSIGERSETTQKFCSQSVNAISSFKNNEYVQLEPTGGTPKPKVFEEPIELTKTKEHRELIESYRNKLDMSNETSDSDKVSPFKEGQATPTLPETKIEVSQPLKRVASDKENMVSDKASKQFKNSDKLRAVPVKKTYGRPAFGTKN